MKEQITLGLSLPLMESFYTIQGEGFHAGKPCYFIRLGGCDVGCHWCDTKDSWDAGAHPIVDIEKIASSAKENGADTAVITGGEPVMYNLEPLTSSLQMHGIQTNLETSGAYPLTGRWDWICLSPKKNVPPVVDIHRVANELKIIIYNNDDLVWAEEHAKKVNDECKLYLQPEWGISKEIMPTIVDYIKSHKQWSLSLQGHKYVDIP